MLTRSVPPASRRACVIKAPIRSSACSTLTSRSSAAAAARSIIRRIAKRLVLCRRCRAVSLIVWLRDLLGTLDHQHGPGQDARIGRRAVAGIDEPFALRQALADELVG